MSGGQSTCSIHSGSGSVLGASGDTLRPSRTSRTVSREQPSARAISRRPRPFVQPPPDLLKPPHRHAAYPHIVNSFVWTHEGSRIGPGGRRYRRAATATMTSVAARKSTEISSLADPWRPSGA